MTDQTDPLAALRGRGPFEVKHFDGLSYVSDGSAMMLTDEMVKDALNLALTADEALAAKDAEIARLRPYYDAVRAAHNGYDPEARAAMPTLQEPATPEQAIKDLLGEAETCRALNGYEENQELRAQVADLKEQLKEARADQREFEKEAREACRDAVAEARWEEQERHEADGYHN